jgi:hypothetical protein
LDGLRFHLMLRLLFKPICASLKRLCDDSLLLRVELLAASDELPAAAQLVFQIPKAARLSAKI